MILTVFDCRKPGLLADSARRRKRSVKFTALRPAEAATIRNLSNKIRKTIKVRNSMIIMPVKEGENIEKALKKFKRKYERTGVLKELRRRQYFTKPSIAKREAMQHAIYVEHMNRENE